MKRCYYDTKQRELIIETIKGMGKDFTIKDIYEKLEGEIGLTTIYRMIDKLEHEGYLNRSIGNNKVIYYQYLEKCLETNHFYLKCNKCGKLIHVDCDCIVKLTNHLFMKHHFRPNKENIIITGVCDNCGG